MTDTEKINLALAVVQTLGPKQDRTITETKAYEAAIRLIATALGGKPEIPKGV